MTAPSTRRGEVACISAVVLLALLFSARTAVPGLFGGIDPRAFLLVSCLAKLAFQGWGAFLAHRCAAGFEPGTNIRRAWRLLSLGLLGFFLGQLSLARYQVLLGTDSPFPSVAEAFFLLAYPLLILALMSFIQAYREAGFPVGRVGENRALIGVVVGVCILLGYPILAPVARSEAPLLERAINLAYPILDLLLLLPTTLLLRATLRFRGGNVQRVWMALLVGVLALAGADIAFAYFSTLDLAQLDSVVDALFIVSYGSFAWASLAQRNLLSR